MNNLMMGGIDPVSGRPWAFYETIGGGSGGRPGKDGASGIQVNMTNTMNSPIEVMEHYYPVYFTSYQLRGGSGGVGRWRGGLGIERAFVAKAKVGVSVLGERSKVAPWGLHGGGSGELSSYLVERKGKAAVSVPSKSSLQLEDGDRLIIRTAGGGGFGDSRLREEESRRRDRSYGYH
jgi:N-methylhydantoinase B